MTEFKTLYIRPYHKSDQIKIVKQPKTEEEKQSIIKSIAGFGIPLEIGDDGIASVPRFQIETADGLFPSKPMTMLNMKLSTYPTEALLYGADQAVKDTNKEFFQQTVFSMIPLMYLAGGVGLASVQVGIKESFFIMDEEFNPNIEKKINPRVVYNPSYSIKEDTVQLYSREGCLSVPSMQSSMLRYNHITLSYHDINKQIKYLDLHGLACAIAQHECDHLRGETIHKHLKKLEKIKYSSISKKYKTAERKAKHA